MGYILLPFIFSIYSKGQSTILSNGVYKILNSEQYYTIALFNSKTSLFSNDGKIYNLSSNGSGFLIGNSLGSQKKSMGDLSIYSKGVNEFISLNILGKKLEGEKLKLIEKRIEFSNGNQKLVGELILPTGSGPFPLIVQTHGSGQETRESGRGLAYFFATHGIASFIFDKRGCGESIGKDWQASFKDYAKDLLAAVDNLSEESSVNSNKIGLYGHSQGGWIVPLAYSMKPGKIAFCIISAANALSPVEQNLYAGYEELKLKGIDEITNKEIYDFRKIKYEVGITGKGMSEYKNSIFPSAQEKTWFNMTGGNLPENTFWKENGFYDPSPALKALKCPVLILYAGYDISTDTNTNLPIMKKLISSANATYHVFENANHAMLEVEGKNFMTKQTVNNIQFTKGYLELLIEWTKGQTK